MERIYAFLSCYCLNSLDQFLRMNIDLGHTSDNTSKKGDKNIRSNNKIKYITVNGSITSSVRILQYSKVV